MKFENFEARIFEFDGEHLWSVWLIDEYVCYSNVRRPAKGELRQGPGRVGAQTTTPAGATEEARGGKTWKGTTRGWEARKEAVSRGKFTSLRGDFIFKLEESYISLWSLEAERKKQLELERQMERQRQIEQQREEERRKAHEQREVINDTRLLRIMWCSFLLHVSCTFVGGATRARAAAPDGVGAATSRSADVGQTETTGALWRVEGGSRQTQTGARSAGA